MDVEGFREYLEKKTSSQSVLQFITAIVSQFEYVLKTFLDLNEMDDATIDHLLNFGKWAKEEGIVEKYMKSYKKYVSTYYEYKDMMDLSKIAKQGFKK